MRPYLPQQILNSLNSIATAAAVQNVDAMAVAAVFWAFELDPSSFKLGLTRAFFKTGQLGTMEKVLRVDWAVEGQRICNRVKLWIVRRRWRSATAKVVSQNAFLCILLASRKRDAATALLQSQWRGFLQKQRFGKQKSAALVFERIARGHFGRLKGAQIAVQFQKELVQKREETARVARERALQAEAEERARLEEEARLAEEEHRRAEAELQRRKEEEDHVRAEMEMEQERLQKDAEEKRLAYETQLQLKKEADEDRKKAEEEVAALALATAAATAGISGMLISGAGSAVLQAEKDAAAMMRRSSIGRVSSHAAISPAAQKLGSINQQYVAGGLNKEELARTTAGLLDELLGGFVLDDIGGDDRVSVASLHLEEQNVYFNDPRAALYRWLITHLLGLGYQVEIPGAFMGSDSEHQLRDTNLALLTAEGNFVRETTPSMTWSIQNNRTGDLIMGQPGVFSSEPLHYGVVAVYGGHLGVSMYGHQIHNDAHNTAYTEYVLQATWSPLEMEHLQCTWVIGEVRYNIASHSSPAVLIQLAQNTAIFSLQKVARTAQVQV